MELLGVIPGLDKAVTNREGGSLVGSHVVKVEAGASQSVLDVVDDAALDGALVGADVGVHELPHLLLAGGLRAELGPVQRLAVLLALRGLTLGLGQVEPRVFPLEAALRLSSDLLGRVGLALFSEGGRRGRVLGLVLLDGGLDLVGLLLRGGRGLGVALLALFLRHILGH